MLKKISTLCSKHIASVALVGFIAMILACTSTQSVVTDDTNNPAYGDRAEMVDSIASEAAYDMAMK